jgi:hypothetical protein
MRPIACLVSDPPQLVSELIDDTSASCNKVKIQQCFSRVDSDIILGMPLCTRTVSDFWSWNFGKRGLFTVRSTYRMLVLYIKQRREALLQGTMACSTGVAEAK